MRHLTAFIYSPEAIGTSFVEACTLLNGEHMSIGALQKVFIRRFHPFLSPQPMGKDLDQ